MVLRSPERDDSNQDLFSLIINALKMLPGKTEKELPEWRTMGLMKKFISFIYFLAHFQAIKLQVHWFNW